MLFAIIATTFLGFFTHLSFTTQEFENKKLYLKFYSLGKYSSSIIHDIKGLIHSPLNYPQMMEYSLNNNIPTDEIKEMCLQQRIDLESFKNMIFGFSEFLNNNLQSSEKVNIKQMINECLFLSRTENFNITHSATDIDIITNKTLFKKIIFNIIKNTTDAIKNQNDRKINFIVENNCLLISDNGSGFPEGVLKNIESNTFSQMISSKEEGSGFGLFITKELANQINCSISFFNNKGANIKIVFPNT